MTQGKGEVNRGSRIENENMSNGERQGTKMLLKQHEGKITEKIRE
jgi:hypothetical protein